MSGGKLPVNFSKGWTQIYLLLPHVSPESVLWGSSTLLRFDNKPWKKSTKKRIPRYELLGANERLLHEHTYGSSSHKNTKLCIA